jgi:hypothetical protein
MNEDDNKPVRLVVNNSNEISDLSTLEISVPFGDNGCADKRVPS